MAGVAVSIRCNAKGSAELYDESDHSHLESELEVSIRCNAKGSAEPVWIHRSNERGEVSIRCNAKGSAEPRILRRELSDGLVSIRCNAKGSAEPQRSVPNQLWKRFLFAVTRRAVPNERDYPLPRGENAFLFAVTRRAVPNPSYALTQEEVRNGFLFAVTRRAVPNLARLPSQPHPQGMGFYSL